MNQHIQRLPFSYSRPTKWLEIVALVAIIAGSVWLFVTDNSGDQANKLTSTPAPTDMVLVPGGEFLMGNDQRLSRSNEKPVHRVQLDPFWMDRHHVTNAEFRRFFEATRYVTTAERKPD